MVMCCGQILDMQNLGFEMIPLVWHHLCVALNLLTGLLEVAVNDRVSLRPTRVDERILCTFEFEAVITDLFKA